MWSNLINGDVHREHLGL